MTNIQESISGWLNRPDSFPTADEVDRLAKQYPYFTLPATLRLQRATGLSDDERRALTTRIALNAPDAETLRGLLDPTEAEFADFYPPEPEPPKRTTESVIDKFIDTYGGMNPHEEETLERLIFNPTPDYSQLLALEEERSAPRPDEAEPGSDDALINEFILKSRADSGRFPSQALHPRPEPDDTPEPEPSPVSEPEATDDSMLSESLAKIYIRQKNYTRAYEIINNLNLNFPEKSIYFADQLRFLRLLIKNQELAAGTAARQ